MFDVLLLRSVTAPLQERDIAGRNGPLSHPTQERVQWGLTDARPALSSRTPHPFEDCTASRVRPTQEGLLLKCPEDANIKSLPETGTDTEPVRNRLRYLTKVHSDTKIQNASYSCFLARNAFFPPRNGGLTGRVRPKQRA